MNQLQRDGNDLKQLTNGEALDEGPADDISG